MTRKKLLLSLLLALPLAVGGTLAYLNSSASTYTCPLTGKQLPCPKCCPLNQEQSYTCPVTGEELPCPECCPLNGRRDLSAAGPVRQREADPRWDERA